MELPPRLAVVLAVVAATVGLSVDTGGTVAAILGGSVAAAVGAKVGEGVGPTVGAAVGSGVRPTVGVAVGSGVSCSASPSVTGGSVAGGVVAGGFVGSGVVSPCAVPLASGSVVPSVSSPPAPPEAQTRQHPLPSVQTCAPLQLS